MKPLGQRAGDRQPESIEFVPKRELDRVQQENDRLRKDNECLKQETERLRRELEAALRASKRQAANRAAAMAGSRAVPSRRAWMNESRFHCQSAARIAVAAWSRNTAKHSIRKRSSGEP